MEITVVGSGCGIPNPDRGSPCIAVGLDGKLFAFDLGSGALRSMAAAGLDWSKLDALFITHFHTDHVADIAPLLFALNIPDVNRTAPLVLHGPPGMRRFHEKLVAAHGDWLIPKHYDLSVKEIAGVSPEGGGEGWKIDVAPAEHSGPAFAYRLESGGRSLVYTGDTDYCDAIVGLAEGCDLLIAECSYPNDLEAEGHLSPRKAGEMAQRSGCKKLALVHMYPVCEGYDLASECARTYDGEVIVAEDGMKFVLE